VLATLERWAATSCRIVQELLRQSHTWPSIRMLSECGFIVMAIAPLSEALMRLLRRNHVQLTPVLRGLMFASEPDTRFAHSNSGPEQERAELT
jgi:type VI protein secretion system component VasK